MFCLVVVKCKHNSSSTLTDDTQLDEVAHLGLRGHLALVLARVSLLYVAHLQSPRLRLRLVPRREALVRDEGVAVYRQDV